jgi:hypothetical protein
VKGAWRERRIEYRITGITRCLRKRQRREKGDKKCMRVRESFAEGRQQSKEK